MTAPPLPPDAARRILLVDDEPTIRHAMRRYLVRQGWAVDEAEDAGGALALLFGPGAARYDVIVCDLLMPGMSGEELYDRMVAEHPPLARRVIVTTGDPWQAERVVARTGVAVLNKPFELAELRAVVVQVAEAA